MTGFEDLGLSRAILGLIREAGFERPTEPQLRAIPLILQGRNVLIIAPTGSGKTEAALIPVLDMMVRGSYRPIALVYVTPLRALNRDLLDRIAWWAGRLDLRAAVRHGDTLPRERRRQALSPPDILVTTPETLSLLLNARVMSQHLSNVRWVIVDEVHELVDSKRGAQLSIALERLRDLAGDFQVIGLSATVGSPDRVSRFLVGEGRDVAVVEADVRKMMEFRVEYPEPTGEDVALADKLLTYPGVVARLRLIREIIGSHGAALVFTNTRPMAEILSSRLALLDEELPVSVHHGSLSAEKRTRIERMLKEGGLKGVVCTSSLELGIDIGRVDVVVQYNSPRQVTRLIQRVGRSGHWIERVSKGVIVVQDPDDALEALVIAKYALEGVLEEPRIPSKPYDVLAHEVAGYLIKERGVGARRVYETVRRSYVYRDLSYDEFARLLRFLSSLTDKYLHFDEEGGVIRRPQNLKRLFKYYFDNLSMIPEVRQYLVVNEEDGEPIGILDGEFVSEYGEPGFKFIMSGRPWKIVQIYRDRVYVRPEDDPFGAIPYWVGEEIPVPDFVAEEVGRVKRRLEELYREHGGRAIDALAAEYGVDERLLRRALEPYLEQLKRGLPLPTDKRIVVEKFGDKLVVHVHGGTLVNRALALLISEGAFEEYGETLYISSDPYRVVAASPTLAPEDIRRLIAELDLERARELMERGVEKTPYFRWRLMHVARRMGIISKEAELDPARMEQLVASLRGTPAYEEAMRESMERDRDVGGAIRLLARVRMGDIRVICVGPLSKPTPAAECYVRFREVRLEPARSDRLKTLQLLGIRNRLLNEVRTFACLDCLRYIEEARIRDLPDKPTCPICGSTRIGMSSALYDDVARALALASSGRGGRQASDVMRELEESARLIGRYGKAAAVALASTLPIRRVEEILKAEHRVSGRLFKLILEAEKRALLEKFR